jgi:methionyl aminopeptidase
MSISHPHELAGLRAAGRVVRLTLDALEAAVRPGATTAELDAVAARVFDEQGAKSAPALVYGFPGTVLISVNDEVVHGVPGTRRLRSGDVVKLDVTVEKDGFMSDAARTVILGEASDLARRLQHCARHAFELALGVARAGNRVSEIGRVVEREVRRQGFSVVRALSGHGIGRTIHEAPSVPNYYDRRQRDVLTEGLVITIEPLITAGAPDVFEDRDRWTIRTRDGSLAAHHEHTMVITRGAPELLTAA